MFMVASTVITVAFALTNGRRLTPAMAGAPATIVHTPVRASATRPRAFDAAWGHIASRLQLAGLIALAVIALVAAIPAASATITKLTASSAPALEQGPAAELRAASSLGSSWEESYASALAPPSELGAVAMVGAAQREYDRQVETALRQIDTERQAQAASQAQARAQAPGPVTSLNRVSGIGAGTVLAARITIYGCSGPGGGFCGGMASGVRVFEGAAACSTNLPFGTKFTITGDPTGRTYECLDRGALPATWVDVFFNDTTTGIAWQSNLGTTRGEIVIVN